jgi:HSP20 family protein
MADLVPWEPFRDAMTLREAMSRLFEDSFLRPGGAAAPEAAGSWPLLDVYEQDDGLVLKASVPGMNPEELEVTVTGDVLTIQGEHKETTAGEARNYLRREHRYGSFCRQLTLPAGIDTGKINASYENGVLVLELPKREEVKPRTIRVNVTR